MDNKEFGKQLDKKTKIFAIKIIKLSAILPNTGEGRVVKNQITKSGTSVGTKLNSSHYN
jgi:four helix bundle protein